MKIHWIRVIVAAVLFELVLIALTIPIVFIVGIEPFVPFIPVTIFVMGIPVGLWLARTLKSGFVFHGVLVGVIATIIYLGLNLAQSGSLTPAIELYGPVLFVLANIAKVLGCALGAYIGQRRRVTAHASL